MNNQENNLNENQTQVTEAGVNNGNIAPIVNIDSNDLINSNPVENVETSNVVNSTNNVETTVNTTIVSESPIQVSINLESQPSTPEISIVLPNTELQPEQNNSINEKIIEKDFIDEELKKQKSKNNIKSNSILFVFLILAVLSGVIYQLCFRYNDSKIFNDKNNNTATINDDVLNEKITNVTDRTGIFLFSGTYTNENNDSIVEICAINENKAKVSVTYDNSTSITYTSLKNDILLEENEKTNNDYSIIIEKLDNQINITSSSNDENSILNKCNGTYDKKEYESKGWYGTYIFGSSIIYIDEYDTNSVIVNISNIATEHIIDKVTDNSLEFESNNNNVSIKLKIEKANNGIIVAASSSDAQSEYNKISGTYLIKN